MTDHKAREAPVEMSRFRKLLAIFLIGPIATLGGLGGYYALFRQIDWGAAVFVVAVMLMPLITVFTLERTSLRARCVRMMTYQAIGIGLVLFVHYRHFGRVHLHTWIAAASVLAIVLVVTLAVFQIGRRRQACRQRGEPIAPDGRLNRWPSGDPMHLDCQSPLHAHRRFRRP